MKKLYKGLLFILKRRLLKLPIFRVLKRYQERRRKLGTNSNAKPSICECTSHYQFLDVIVNQPMDQSLKELLDDSGWAMEFLRIQFSMTDLKTTDWIKQTRTREHDVTIGMTKLHLNHHEKISKTSPFHTRLLVKTKFENAPMNIGSHVHSETILCLVSLCKRKTHIRVFWTLKFKKSVIFQGNDYSIFI